MTTAVKAGEPKQKEGYSKVELDGLVFYVKDELAGKKLVVDYRGWWLFKGLSVLEK
ncbi:MAG: hypothetical protein AB1767_03785 [Bacillota bacterium]